MGILAMEKWILERAMEGSAGSLEAERLERVWSERSGALWHVIDSLGCPCRNWELEVQDAG